ncbi:histidine kinase [Streptomyces californicus]|uniref:sensor histidine kinase n=1 Tax=Streptomyces californicus TaxID=67351 RepID=UPI0036CB2308
MAHTRTPGPTGEPPTGLTAAPATGLSAAPAGGLSARRVLGDVALWCALAAATVYGFREAGAPSPLLDLLVPLVVLAVAVPLARRRPGAAVALANGLCALGLTGGATPANAQVLSLAAFSCLLGARVAGARGPLLVLVGCLAVDVAVCAAFRAPPVWWFYALTALPGALLLPWLVGRYGRGRRELVREGWRLAHRLEERQHLVAERARLAERADIAADMHDSLGHALSLVALRAGALELSPDLTDRDRTELAELRGTIADAVEQLRETVAVLQDTPAAGPRQDLDAPPARTPAPDPDADPVPASDSTPAPGFASGQASGPGQAPGSASGQAPGRDPGSAPELPGGCEAGASARPHDTIEALIGRAVAAGAPVRWERRGTAPALSPLVERGMYRIVREALTNAVKHAPGGAVRVEVAHLTDRTRVTVVNTVPSPATGPRPTAGDGGGGRGLAGLRERVAVLGGTLRTGPYRGGFRVTAELPHRITTLPPHGLATPPPHGLTTPPPYGLTTRPPHGLTTPPPHRITTRPPHGLATPPPHGGAHGPQHPAPYADPVAQPEHADPQDDFAGFPQTGEDSPAFFAAPVSPASFAAPAGSGPTQSAARLAAVRRSARRRSALAAAAPVLAAAFFVPAAVLLAWQLTTSALPPSRYEELTPGLTRGEVAPALPARAYPYPPDHARSAPRPPGTTCAFYRSGRDLLHEVDLYRLCWSAGRLVAKDTVPATAP